MAKETAHQIGTPLSSLIGWTEILKEENVNKSYITIRVFELIARMPVNSLLKAEIVIPHVYDTSSRHFSVLTDFNAEAMGWYVSEDDGTYWISTYVLMRYYQ
jgi:hypothetical protein